jgi:hypothetical protein
MALPPLYVTGCDFSSRRKFVGFKSKIWVAILRTSYRHSLDWEAHVLNNKTFTTVNMTATNITTVNLSTVVNLRAVNVSSVNVIGVNCTGLNITIVIANV